MSLRVAIQADPPEQWNPATDSTLILSLEAQKRGAELYVFTPDTLSLQDHEVRCTARNITFQEDTSHWFNAKSSETLCLNEMDVVLMRQNPPFDMHYIGATYLLEHLHNHALVLNNPASVRNLPEKLFPLLFGDFMPATLFTRDRDAILHFLDKHRDIVIKPLYGYGGHSVFHLKHDSDNLLAILETLLGTMDEPLVVQRFLPEVVEHDRRVIMINGNVESVFGRIPGRGEIRANFRVGGTAARAELTPTQERVCGLIGKELITRGILFAGVDFIGDWLTEINITSPTGLRAAKDLYDVHPEVAFWDAAQTLLAA